ncbi:MAG TPA: diguanylate cyclase [Steroidobacteraceae bacterium]|nr:diguanylate cyclase [Steroidobacteraceae bacterium]
MSPPDLELLTRIVESDPDGVVVVDAQAPDMPVVYVNPAFERLTGHPATELIGRNLRLLQANDRDQDARQRLAQAIKAGDSCRAMIRNYQKDGTPFWNELAIQPLKGADGRLTHYIGYHRASGERPRLDAKAPATRDAPGTPTVPISIARDDRLTGLYNRSYFEDLVQRDWAIAQRDGRSVAWFLFDIDALGLYNDTFGRNAGDACIRRIARTIAAHFRRASDLTARYDGGTVIAASIGMTAELAAQHARIIRDKVAELHIHHPRCTVQKFVTVSAGITAGVPASQDAPQAQIDKVAAALRQAKSDGRNRVHEAS